MHEFRLGRLVVLENVVKEKEVALLLLFEKFLLEPGDAREAVAGIRQGIDVGGTASRNSASSGVEFLRFASMNDFWERAWFFTSPINRWMRI